MWIVWGTVWRNAVFPQLFTEFSQTLIDVSITQEKSTKDYTGENIVSLFKKTARERRRDYFF